MDDVDVGPLLECCVRQGLEAGEDPRLLPVQWIVGPLHLAGSKAFIANQGKSMFSF